MLTLPLEPAAVAPHLRRVCLLPIALLLSASLVAQTPRIMPTPAADRTEAIEIFRQLIEINTTDTSRGSVTKSSVAMQKRFLDAGFAASDVRLLGPAADKQNLVVRMKGTGGGKPILFLCHLDVVEALPRDWHTDPFKFVEKDDYYYGRGVQDMKESDAALVSTFLRLHREGFKPSRDLILALTSDEEGGSSNGADGCSRIIATWSMRSLSSTLIPAVSNWKKASLLWRMSRQLKRSMPISRLRRSIQVGTARAHVRTMPSTSLRRLCKSSRPTAFPLR